MRVCIFTEDLGTIPTRREALLREAAAITGRPAVAASFVGLRQTRPLPDGTVAFQPYVEPGHYNAVRFTNAILRLANTPLVPRATARAALSRCASSVVEAILACDPDVVLLDVRWGRYLEAALDDADAGPVYVSGEPVRPVAAATPTPVADSPVLVSIVLPTHNGSKYLRQSIDSCLVQSHRNLELIVVDDGSTEDIRAIVAEFTDERIRFVRHPRNKGLPAALNTGFQAAAGNYLTWTSDDNYYAPGAIAQLVRFLQRHPQVDFVYSSMFIVDDSERTAPRIRRALPPSDLKHQNSVGACFLYTRQVYAAVGQYDSGAILVEDYDYWVRVSKRFRMQRLLDPLYYYRYHAQSLTSKHGADDVARRFDLVRQQNEISTVQ
jgi:hypothetical protein